MRNGSRSNKSILHKLVLVNSNGQPFTGQDVVDDAAYAYDYDADDDKHFAPAAAYNKGNTLIVAIAVTITCTAAAIATGSYAVWLMRHQATQQALTDVNDLLETCKTRMEQLELDVQHLPRRATK